MEVKYWVERCSSKKIELGFSVLTGKGSLGYMFIYRMTRRLHGKLVCAMEGW